MHHSSGLQAKRWKNCYAGGYQLVPRSLMLLYGVVVSFVDSSDILYSVYIHHLPSLSSMLLLVGGLVFYRYPNVLHWVYYGYGRAIKVSIMLRWHCDYIWHRVWTISLTDTILSLATAEAKFVCNALRIAVSRPCLKADLMNSLTGHRSLQCVGLAVGPMQICFSTIYQCGSHILLSSSFFMAEGQSICTCIWSTFTIFNIEIKLLQGQLPLVDGSGWCTTSTHVVPAQNISFGSKRLLHKMWPDLRLPTFHAQL